MTDSNDVLDDFCIFIISHDRPENVPSVSLLDRRGYSGDWYIVIDHPDDIEPYEDEWGEDRVIYFDKDDVAPEIDRGDNLNRRNSILYARHACFQLARDRDYTYFMEWDDDFSSLEWRYDPNGDYGPSAMEDFDHYLRNAIRYLEDAGLDTLCMAQGGDFIGGSENREFAQEVTTKRKAMNTFLCRSDREFAFRGSINEDVNTYVRAQQLGKVFLTTNIASISQEPTQQNEGGLTDLYLATGTYVKSFYTLLYSPSSVSLSTIQDRNQARIHHRINWRRSVPKILPESARNDTTGGTTVSD